MLDMIERLSSVTDFDQSLTHSNVIFFAFAAWSGPARQSRDTINGAVTKLRRDFPVPAVSIFEVDFTEQRGEMWDRATVWLASQSNIDAASYMYSGAGSVAWIR